ncbi:CrcB-like protein-domain-containing protein [Phycomyces nitens]|nr:CrcB-like protein-domain-containing protein [Phycomyces nitens]
MEPNILTQDAQTEISNERPTIVNLEIHENKLAIVGAIVPMSILGVLIRIGLQRLETYPGAPVFGLVYAQWVGCFIMGIAVKNKNAIHKWQVINTYHTVQGLSSGLCGSITTFSSWQLDIFKAFSNYYSHPHTRGYNILDAISQLLVTMAISFNGFVFGQHAGELIEWLANKVNPKVYKEDLKIISHGFTLDYLSTPDYSVIVFGILCWLGVVFAAIFTTNQKELALACVFAPVGALLRWYLSFYNIYRAQRFPLGTFIANIFGTGVLAALALSLSGPQISSMSCAVVQALADGFCGCLTTISTFMVELNTLSMRRSYVYGMTTIVIAQCLMFVILGPYIWVKGVDQKCI